MNKYTLVNAVTTMIADQEPVLDIEQMSPWSIIQYMNVFDKDYTYDVEMNGTDMSLWFTKEGEARLDFDIDTFYGGVRGWSTL